MLSDLHALHERLAHVRAVFFDWDGVLADTGEDNYRAWVEAFGQFGIEIGREECFLLEGRKVIEIAQVQLEKAAKASSLAAEIAREKDRYYLEHSRAALFPGVKEMLKQLRAAGFAIAVVSGATRWRLSQPPASDISGLVDLMISGDDCQCGKPSPEPYLAAAERVRVDPTRCLVVENAPLGIRSAVSAGILCIAVASSLGKKALEEADWVLDQTTQLSELLLPAASVRRILNRG